MDRVVNTELAAEARGSGDDSSVGGGGSYSALKTGCEASVLFPEAADSSE